ncbi:beta-ketoacyl synthase N-terminal-like domain-containing protein [Actinocrispum wychmicini]|uniref:Beta-ketoacyl synthase-like protein n=1 Tax=Actinocrispum wychmicini TaxID=1213861 RepID=A0A4R2IMU4_9PSEU|nr:polyketide synthase [Actinocrispum wychmicini]TCO45319.1 beta-ketoacyl synthase-like protein [Actinocrispum wychmicini]
MTDYNGDEIAIVGLAGRFPGAPDVPSLWRNLLDCVDAVDGHIEVADFDAEFFGVPDDEALDMDPQHRIFLEESWAALQDTGFDPDRDQRAVGVFAGASINRYFLHRLARRDWAEWPASRWAPDYLPAQVAYRLGLTGPAIAVQTACSSSLVAVCTAAQSLLDFRCDLALAGGVGVTEPRSRFVQGGLVSPDGRCRAFDAAGQGSGYGSGAAVLVLERLADAVERGDQVYAVLRGWAVNNDGAARAGFAAPGLAGQAAVVVEALAGASLTGADIGYVEAHGSGTLVGDAIEVAALTEAFGALTECALGSVKTNLGNLDAAAGAAGLIKAVLAVRDGMIPANLHYQTPNPEIDFGPFFVPVKTTQWRQPVRRAAVSSFGLGGTNAHVIVEQPPPQSPRPEAAGPHVLALSARTPEALREFAGRLRLSALRLDDVAYTLAMGRRAYPHRAAVVCADETEALAALDRIAAGEPSGPSGDSQADAWAAGADWAGRSAGRVVSLPPHPLRPRRYWTEA